jgi:PIN domain nuclease of toxin-antitoxin system
MNLLLDTHAFLWFCQDDPALSATAKALIENPANRKLVSVASCWEIAVKAGLGKMKLGEPSASYIATALNRTGFDLLMITVAHATGVEGLPMHHRDPFDRLLVAQVIAEGFSILSRDVILDAYWITRMW